MTAPKRDIIYIDIEDEITTVIDKVVSAKPTIIALVPPKRAPILQSIVNMKLLKRRADQAGKKIVLVTSEAGLLPLAAMSKIHVAKNLQSKPAIPSLGTEEDADAAADVEETETAVGDLDKASKAASEAKQTKEDAPEVEDVPDDLAIDDEPEPTEKKSKAKKMPKIPNFDTFRKKLFLGGGIFVLLIFVWYIMFGVLPKGTVTVKAETSRIGAETSFTVQTNAPNDDVDKGLIVGQSKEIQKTVTQDFTSSGEKNTGTKAAGSITIRNCDYSDGFTVAAGTKFTDSSGKVFASTSGVSVPAFTGASSSCNLNGGSSGKAEVDVEASEAGDNYNLGARSYSVAGISGKVDAQGTQMTGGTTKIVKVVSQGDVDGAKQKISSQDTTEVKASLAKELGNDVIVLSDTFTATLGDAQLAPAVGEAADTGKVTVTVTYRTVGVKKDSFKNIIRVTAEKQYDANKQKVYDDGVSSATIKLDKKINDQTYSLNVKTDVYVGPQIDEIELAKQVTGKRTGEAEEIIRKQPGVRDVKVTLKPFYTKRLPKPGKIEVNFEVQAVDKQ